MRRLPELFTILFLIISSNLFSQDLSAIKGDKPKYLLEKLDRGVNTIYDDVKPIITPDGLRLYYYVTDHPDNHDGVKGSQDIWYAERDSLNGNWKDGIHMSDPFNHHQFNAVLSVLEGGNALLLKGGKSRGDMNTFSIIRKSGGKWGSMDELKIEDISKMNNGKFFGGFMSDDEKVLFIYMSEVKDQVNSDIYVSFDQGGNSWSKPQKIGKPINTFQDEFGPFLTKDNSTLFFSSGKPGGLGNIDIYKSKRLDDTYLNWSEPENIGPPINTKGFDAYFSMDETGQNMFTTRAYKSADGGSLDILSFVPRPPDLYIEGNVFDKNTDAPLQAFLNIKPENEDSRPVAVDPNGHYKVELSKQKKYTLFASFDNYDALDKSTTFQNVESDTTVLLDFPLNKLAAKINLSGLTTKKGTFDPIQANIKLSLNAKEIKKFTTSENLGDYDIYLPEPGYYYFDVGAEGYLALRDSLEVEDLGEDQNLSKNFELTALEVGITVRLNNIYFDFDKTNLRPESFPELDKLVEMMETNANLEIEISGHTDSKGSDQYNQELSQGRAEAVREYVVQQGIDGNRMSAVGYGESKPETTNDTEEGRQINRRVEFTVLKAN
jgi:outer membrane protein OmpA-like peptidoglycan-associated protein